MSNMIGLNFVFCIKININTAPVPNAAPKRSRHFLPRIKEISPTEKRSHFYAV